jgi:hypothetical protein
MCIEVSMEIAASMVFAAGVSTLMGEKPAGSKWFKTCSQQGLPESLEWGFFGTKTAASAFSELQNVVGKISREALMVLTA